MAGRKNTAYAMMRCIFTLILFVCITSHCFGQADTVRSAIDADHENATKMAATGQALFLEKVVVTGLQPSSPRLTSLHIEGYSLADLEKRSPYNLSDALAQLPGISQLSTGNAISKPVIRGLYGNRILVLLSGLRFDNQQFQDEHGMGLSQIGLDRVEVIRGPASILYGTDAIGGVINVIEEKPAGNGTAIDMGTRLYSGTLGTLTDIGLAHRNADTRLWYRVRAGIESNGDYADGSGTRVFDSRNTGYYFKAGFGFEKPRWEMNNAYNFSFNQFGFILDSFYTGTKTDARWSRSMTNPHHNVLLNVFSSQNTFYLGSSAQHEGGNKTSGAVLKVNAGVQSNKRAEDEGGGEISLDMHLLSVLESARVEKYITPNLLLIGSQQTTYENNTNYGKRILIPDAEMLENSFSGFIRFIRPKVVLEAGVGLTLKNIETNYTGALNAPGKGIQPFSILRQGSNFLGGISYNPNGRLNIKGNISTGLRAANLAELASNGLHEGTIRYEIGDPNLRMEQVISSDVTLEYYGKKWFLSASMYANIFSNYIYLSQTSDTAQGIFPIFRYLQQDATIWGGELTGNYRFTRHFQAKESFSYTRGETSNGGNLPFIPPAKDQFSLVYTCVDPSKTIRQFDIEPEADYHFKYARTGPFETTNPDYLLLNLHLNAGIQAKGHFYTAGLSFRNLLNATYADALSRLRYYGINNQGLNVILSLRTTLGFERKQNVSH